jgi:ubiquinone/menaquinone biosynthesis C-methylase UbiE
MKSENLGTLVERDSVGDMLGMGKLEFFAMNTPVKRLFHKHVEFRIFKELLIRHNVDIEGKTTMDAGCGSGYSSKLILREFRPSKLFAFDLMPEQIELARRNYPEIEFFIGNMTAIDAEDESFDVAFVFGVLHHIKKWRVAVQEVVRVLKPKGFLLVEEPRIGFTWREFEKGIGASGLTMLDHRKFLLGYFRSYICQKP